MTKSERWSALSGILFVALFVIGLVVTGESGDTPAEVREFYVENEGRIFTGFFILLASVLALLWFVATLRSLLARAEGEPRTWTALGFAGGVVTAALLAASAAVFAAPAEVADEDGAALSASAADILDTASYFVATSGISIGALLVFATSLVALRTRILPVWLAWVGFVVAAITLAAPAFLPVIVFLAWVLVVSVVLLVRPAPAEAIVTRPE